MSKFIEPVITQMKSIIDSNLGGFLDTIDTEYGDFTLDDPETYDFRVIKADIYPYLDIYPIDSPGNDYNANQVDCQHEVAVHIGVADQDTSTLHKRVYRYLRAITETIKATDDLGSNVSLCEFAGHEYDDLEAMDGGAYCWGGTAKFIITNEETVQS